MLFNFIKNSYMRSSLIFILLLNFAVSKAQYVFTISPQEVYVNSLNIFELTITNQQDTLPIGTQLKLMTPGEFSPILFPVFTNISASTNGNGGINIISVKTALGEKPPIWPDDNHPKVITYQIVNNPILPGEKITLKMGATLAPIKTSSSAGPDYFKLARVLDVGQWEEIGVVAIKIKPLGKSKMELYLPSVAKKGETYLLRMVALDYLNNRATSYTGTFQLIVSDPVAAYSQTIHFSPNDSGYVEIPITFNSNGFFNVKAIFYNELNNIVEQYQSNYAWVQDDPEYYIHWGDLHSHSHMSRDAIGFNPFEYARYTACLDYYTLTEHVDGFAIETYGVDSMEWEYIKAKVKEHHSEGSFVTILAFEATFDAEEGGNHIAYFNVLDEDIDDVETISRDKATNIWDFWDYLDQLPDHIKALAWPHFTDADIFDNPNNPFLLVGPDYISPYRPLYEMYSSHGQSEYYNPSSNINKSDVAFWFVQDALARGEKVGFIAASDNHNAKPGQRGYGIAASITRELNRNSLFETFTKRLTYSSTGDRIILEFKLNGHLMGSEVELPKNEFPNFEIMAYGTDIIEFIELVKWDFSNPNYGNDVHPDFTTIKRWDINSISIDTSFSDLSFSSNSVYYLRLKQVNSNAGTESWAWSSPIWVNGETILSSIENSFIELMSIFPSLVSTHSTVPISLSFNGLQNNSIKLKVYDILSREVYQSNENIHVGSNLIHLSTSQFSSGRYFIALEDQLGKKFAVNSFIVQ